MSDLVKSVLTGNRVVSLERLRDYLAKTLERPGLDDRTIAPIAKRLEDVMRELDQLNPPKQESAVDDLAKRRAVRRKTAGAPDGTAVGKQRGSRSRRPAEGSGPAT